MRGLRRCSYTTIWAGLTSRASWKAHRALRFRDSGVTPTGSLRAIAITLPIRQTCRGSASYCGRFESITLSFSPETLALWVPDISAVIKNKIDSHCCCQQHRCNAETHLTAQALRHALMRMHSGFSHEQKPSTLWLQGQSLVMLSLVLDEHREDASCLSCHFTPMERQKLLRAKDLLLADLTQAPGVAELARESGLSVLKIKRGFRVLFNNSVYGLFQAERMQEARRRLANGNTSVMTVAADLGYANASHFSAAFQKQFGVTPSTFKRGM